MKKIILMLAVFSGICFALTSYAEHLAIGVVDFQKVLQNTPQAQAADKRLRAIFEPLQKKIEAKRTTLSNLLQELKRNGPIMKKTDKAQLTQKIEKKRTELGKMMQSYQKKLAMEQSKSMKQVMDHLKNTIKKVAEKNKLELVVPQAAVLYHADQLDITAQVLKAVK